MPTRLPGSLHERWDFVRSFVRDPRGVGAVLPTSRWTARAMLDLAPMARAERVVELGAGTGPITREILPRLAPGARLLAFEVDEALAGRLAADLPDPRLQVLTDSAATMEAHLEGRRADVIISAIPFTSLPADVGREILLAARRALADDGVFVVLQYSPLIERRLRPLFGSVTRRMSVRNVPPAFLYACRNGGG
jgi:phospholipid N-methyltransferase